MRYRPSKLDEDNFKWMAHDNSCRTLCVIKLIKGHMRGLFPFNIEFTYPISVIAGENGCGKSTLLAIAACAYHNFKTGYKPIDRNKPYYTFNDFFIQSSSELPPSGIEIQYTFLHDHWKEIEPGIGRQKRIKSEKGKWNDYDTRIKRNVIVLGIQRIVPPSERSAHKSYSHKFRPARLDATKTRQILDIASRILDKKYIDYSLHQISKYRLPLVNTGILQYSGFNMGAGENAVFNILTILFEAGRGSLLIIDEIELGLHEKAQRRLIEELKRLCLELHCQIICSTHSGIIISALPPKARFFIESSPNKTNIITEISADYASGKLAGRRTDELVIFVEDDIAKAIVREILPLDIRERVNVLTIGSSTAVLRQLSACYREKRDACLIFLDGDKQIENNENIKIIKGYLEHRFRTSGESVDDWITERLKYIPGDTWPENWIINKAIECNLSAELATLWGTSPNIVVEKLEGSLRAEKHNEFYDLSQNLQLSEDKLRDDIIRCINLKDAESLGYINECIKVRLKAYETS